MLRLIRDQRENERSKRGRNEIVLIPNHVFGVDVFIGMRIAGFSHTGGPQTMIAKRSNQKSTSECCSVVVAVRRQLTKVVPKYFNIWYHIKVPHWQSNCHKVSGNIPSKTTLVKLFYVFVSSISH